MSDDLQGKLVFDFNRAVAAAKADYPRETRKTTFINPFTEDSVDEIADWIKSTAPQYQERILQSETAEDMAMALIVLNGGGFSMRDPVSGKSLMLMPADAEDNPLTASGMTDLPADIAAFFGFNHELGHIIHTEGLPDTIEKIIAICNGDGSNHEEIVRRQEIYADTFAVVRGLQQGVLGTEEIGRIVAMRDEDGADHGTQDALRALAARYRNGTPVPSTPAAAKLVSAAHARPFARKIQL